MDTLGVVEALALLAGLALVLVAAVGVTLQPFEQAWADYRRLRADYLPELIAATELLLVATEFRHHTARLDVTRPT